MMHIKISKSYSFNTQNLKRKFMNTESNYLRTDNYTNNLFPLCKVYTSTLINFLLM
jgi:hypothetical protein